MTTIRNNTMYVLRRLSRSFLQRRRPGISRLASTSTQAAEDMKPQEVKFVDELPGPGIFENILDFIRKGGFKNLLEIQSEKLQKFGPIFQEGFFGEKIVHVADAEAFEVISRNEGPFPSRGFDFAIDAIDDMPMYALIGNRDYEKWKEARSPIAPTFLRPMEIQKFAPGVNSVAEDAVKRLRREMKDGRITNLKHELDGYATENICLLIFGERMGFYETPQNPKILEFIQTAYDFNVAVSSLIFGLRLWKYVETPGYKRLTRCKEQLFRLGTEFGEMSEAKQRTRNNTCLYDKITVEEGKTDVINGLAIALSQVGVETTSTSLAWCLYHLSRNPEEQEKAYQEIVSAMSETTSKESSEMPQLHAELPFLKACIKECMRFSQIGFLHTRVLEKDTVLCGYRIPAKTVVTMWPSFLCQSPEHFTNPELFQPQRWLRDEKREKIHSHAYTPFGFGVRMCLGRRFAELELVYSLAHIIHNFQLEYIGEGEIKGVISKAGLYAPEKELPIRFIERV